MRIVFCDDNIEILNQLQRYVSEFFRGLSSTMPEFASYASGDELLKHETSLDKEIPINTAKGITVISAERIICVELVQRKTTVYTCEGTLQSTDNIEHWREILTLPCFYSTYRSFIINMRYVYKVEKDRVILKYDDRIKEAYLAKRKYSEFSKKYLVYLESIK